MKNPPDRKSLKKTDDPPSRKQRVVPPVEEKAKRGRWVTVAVLLMSLLLSYVFYMRYR